MRKILMFLATVIVALTVGQAAAADRQVAQAIPFMDDEGDISAASISAAVSANRITATATPFISEVGDLWVTVNYGFGSLDVQHEWNSSGWPGYIDGVEVFLLATAVLPGQTPVYKAISDTSGNTQWSFAHNWTGAWLSDPNAYQPYLSAQSPSIAGRSGSQTVLIASKQYLDRLPESPRDSQGNVNYNYTAYIMFDPIDSQFGFPADGKLTKGTDGFFKFYGLMFFGRKLNGQLELYGQ